MLVLVVGAGVMGHGIAELAALAELDVVMVDVTEDYLAKGLEKIRWSLDKFVEKKRLTREQAERALGRIRTSTNLEEAASQADFMIEAVPENLELKKKIFTTVSRMAKPTAILATNTSTLPITELAEATNSPERVVGMHFFNPPPLMPLVEVVMGEKTSRETVEATVELGRRMGKHVIVCRKDVPGFIVNRILAPLLNEACWMVHRGEASVVEIDSAVRFRVGLPMGVFELADYSGLDVFYMAFTSIRSREPGGLEVCPIFQQYYERGMYGQKSGRGFYEYRGDKYERPEIPRDAGQKIDLVRLFAPSINSAAWIVRNGVASIEDVETAVKLGLGYPSGILEMADNWGLDNVVHMLESLMVKYGEAYKPDPLLMKLVSEGKTGRRAGEGFHRYEKEEGIYSEIVLKREPPLAWLTLNRPHRLNAISPKMIEELKDAIKKLERDEGVRVIVLKGAGDRAFSAGADISAFTEAATPARGYQLLTEFQELTNTMESLSKPLIAAVDGYALGGGCELILACDIRLATDRSEFGQPEILLGLIPGAGGTQRLPRIVGVASAKELILVGERIDAAEAHRIGLVNKVFPAGNFYERVRETAMKLAERPPLALKAAKQAINISRYAPLDLGLAVERSLFSLLLSTEDFMEGVSAFFSKRKPSFKGR
ncbi:MAG: 3-hydroxyacyl-CoA dehydrogenase/enoyl-CoA hydratase family protein [Nitrososphaerota archaeon]